MTLVSNQKIKKAVLTAIVIKADGSRHDLGIVAHSNPIKHLYHRVRTFLKGRSLNG